MDEDKTLLQSGEATPQEADEAVAEVALEAVEETAVAQAEAIDGAVARREVEALVGGEEEEENGVDGIGACSDFIVHQLSIENNVEKLHRGLKLREDVASYIVGILYILAGAACIILPHQIEHVLPYVVGGVMLLVSLIQFVFAIINKEYKRTNTNKTASSLILMGLGVLIVCRPEWAHSFIIIMWGVLGLCEGAMAFNHALARISKGMRCSYYIIKGIVEVAVAFLLLYDSNTYGVLHIIIFGISLAIDGIVVLPFWKKIFDR